MTGKSFALVASLMTSSMQLDPAVWQRSVVTGTNYSALLIVPKRLSKEARALLSTPNEDPDWLKPGENQGEDFWRLYQGSQQRGKFFFDLKVQATTCPYIVTLAEWSERAQSSGGKLRPASRVSVCGVHGKRQEALLPPPPREVIGEGYMYHQETKGPGRIEVYEEFTVGDRVVTAQWTVGEGDGESLKEIEGHYFGSIRCAAPSLKGSR